MRLPTASFPQSGELTSSVAVGGLMRILGLGFKRAAKDKKKSERESLPSETGPFVQDTDARRSLLSKGLARTRQTLSNTLKGLFGGMRRVSEEELGRLQEALILADVGIGTVDKIMVGVKEGLGRLGRSDGEAVKQAVRGAMLQILSSACQKQVPGVLAVKQRPYVCLVVGINGTGKTTTIAKLAWRYKRMGLSSVLVAADTFRAAAIEQLGEWAKRAGADLIKHKEGASPAAVVYDGIKAASSRGVDLVIVDTAGRLHTRKNLMAELAKVKRVAAANAQGAPHETLLVLDATCGQNAVSQARQFNEWLQGITGLVLAKIDGTAKGGVVITIADELGIPIQYLGTGERLEDLVDFDPAGFVDALLG